jgi:hypothetical protein
VLHHGFAHLEEVGGGSEGVTVLVGQGNDGRAGVVQIIEIATCQQRDGRPLRFARETMRWNSASPKAFVLSQYRDVPERYGLITTFETMPSNHLGTGLGRRNGATFTARVYSRASWNDQTPSLCTPINGR